MTEYRDQFFRRHPVARALDAALRSGSNPTPMFYLSDSTADADLARCAFILMRLGDELERVFQINGEIAVVLAPFSDFQRRGFIALTTRLADIAAATQNASNGRGGGARFSPTTRVVLLVSGDKNALAKIKTWQGESGDATVVVVLEPEVLASDGTPYLRRRLREALGSRDLYKANDPVTDIDFFGRDVLLAQARTAMSQGHNFTVLGLRRSGKTSVIEELRRRLLPARVVVSVTDFQTIEHVDLGAVPSIIAQNLNEDLRRARAGGHAIWMGDDADQGTGEMSWPGFSQRLRKVASRNPALRFVIAFDEVESAFQIARLDPAAIRTIFGALRAAAQHHSNVSLAFSGVASRMFRSATLGAAPTSVDNPLFNQVESFYVRPFSRVESEKLLRGLGKPMFLSWSDEAIDRVHGLSGGIPFLLRELASMARSSALDRSGADADLEVDLALVLSYEADWLRRGAELWGQIRESLALHYPNAADLLSGELSPTELTNWASSDGDYVAAAEMLADLGLLERSGDQFSAAEPLRAMHSLAGGVVPRVSRDPTLEELVIEGENHVTEFKSTARVNLRTSSKDGSIEHEVLKTVAALMNADGGSLIIGVTDGGQARALEEDLALFGHSWDRYERWLLGDLLGKRIGVAPVAASVRFQRTNFRGVDVVWLRISRVDDPVWVDGKQLFLRSGNATLELVGPQVVEFVQRRP